MVKLQDTPLAESFWTTGIVVHSSSPVILYRTWNCVMECSLGSKYSKEKSFGIVALRVVEIVSGLRFSGGSGGELGKKDSRFGPVGPKLSVIRRRLPFIYRAM
ncbi:MAG: hypothetical protein ACOX3Q_15305 [Clostridia bacterium]